MNNYIVGNARNILDIFNSNNLPSPDLIISSPPYYDVLNYENNKEQIGYGQNSYEEYLNDVVNVFQNCYNLSKENASFWLIVDTFKKEGETITLPFDINSAFKRLYNETTWKLKEIIIWDKEKNLPWSSKGKFKNRYEYILYYTKNDNYKFNIDKVREITDLKKWWKKYPERYNPDGKAPSNIWEYITPMRGWGNGKQNHFCPFPFPLIERIISISSDENDYIFDPFAGSGSVLAMAKQMNRNSFGIDINKGYKKLFKKEVMIGAKAYWENRVLELDNIKDLIIDFKNTNNKLRKLKAINCIIKYFNVINNSKLIYLAIDANINNNIKLYINKNQNNPVVDVTDEKIINLLKQIDISINIEILCKEDIIDKLKKIKLYKYRHDKFYSYSSSTIINNVFNNEEFNNYFYSNIHIQIP
jgi:DNA modification methylase